MPESLFAMVTRVLSPGVPQDVTLALLSLIRPWNQRFYLDGFQEISGSGWTEKEEVLVSFKKQLCYFTFPIRTKSANGLNCSCINWLNRYFRFKFLV